MWWAIKNKKTNELKINESSLFQSKTDASCFMGFMFYKSKIWKPVEVTIVEKKVLDKLIKRASLFSGYDGNHIPEADILNNFSKEDE